MKINLPKTFKLIIKDPKTADLLDDPGSIPPPKVEASQKEIKVAATPAPKLTAKP